MSTMNPACDLAWPAHPDLARPVQAEPRSYGFWGSLGWGLFAVVTALFAAVVCTIVWMLAHELRTPTAADAGFANLAGAVAAVVALVVLAIAVKCRRQSLRDYFALRAVRPRDFLLGLAALLALIVVSEVAERLFGIDTGSKSVGETYQAAKLAGALPMLWLAVVVVAPITEELMFRGFLYRGWANSWLGTAGTIVLTSALWAALHQQYNAYGIFWIFVMGLILGRIRQRSGSTTPTIILHALNNLAATLFVTIQVEWLG